MEKYRSQTWDAWTDMRTLGIRDGGIAMGTQRSLGWDRWTWARLVGFR